MDTKETLVSLVSLLVDPSFLLRGILACRTPLLAL